MKFTFEKVSIEVFDDDTFTPFSADNRIPYQHQYIAEPIKVHHQYPSSTVGILVTDQVEEKVVASAIICGVGGSTIIHSANVLKVDNQLLICSGNTVYALHLPDLALNWKTECDQATCFSIHLFKGGCVMHGELQISFLGLDGNIIWEFSARDIFVTYEGVKDFRIEEGLIIVKDWSGYEYYLDEWGKVIKENRL